MAADGLFVSFCLYLTVLLYSLRDDVFYLLEVKDNKQEATAGEDERIVRQLERLIDRHNEIAALTDRLSGVLVEITLGHFVTSSLIIGSSMIDMLLVS